MNEYVVAILVVQREGAANNALVHACCCFLGPRSPIMKFATALLAVIASANAFAPAIEGQRCT